MTSPHPRENTLWSVGLGNWFGVPVRLHIFFLLFAVFTFYLSWRERGDGQAADWLAAQSLLVLLASVVLHEVAHAWTAHRLGGYAEQIDLGPLGGMTPVRGLHDPSLELTAFAAGPIANAIACCVCVPVLIASSVNPLTLMNPISPVGLTEGSSFLVWVKLAFWINFGLFLVNMIPAFPLDGGRILRAAISRRWPLVNRSAAVSIVAGLAQLASIGLFVIALVWQFDEASHVISLRLALVLLAIFLFFSAKLEVSRAAEEELALEQVFHDEYGYEFPESHHGDEPFAETGDFGEHAAQTNLHEPHAGPLRRWLDQRREQSRRLDQATAADDEHRADEILQQVHQHGLDSLTDEDRAVLQRVSERYRARLARSPSIQNAGE